MSGTRTFEGPSLSAVLKDVHAEYGSDAHIVSTRRELRGGVGGFFSQETFVVEVAEDGYVPGDDDTDPLDVLLDEMDSEDGPDNGFMGVLAGAVAPPAAADTPAPTSPLPPEFGGDDRSLEALLAALDTLPAAPEPNERNGVVVVVGAPSELPAALSRVAAELGVPAADAMVVDRAADTSVVPPWQAVTTLTEARRRAGWWERQARPALAAVPVRDDTEATWAAKAVSALSPVHVRFACDATEPAARISERVAAVGRVDSVDLVNVAASPCLADLLSLPAPVAVVDGRPASSGLWAALFLDGRRG